jgi:hypothetical protein
MNMSWIVIAVLSLLLCLSSKVGRGIFARAAGGLYAALYAALGKLLAGYSAERDERLTRLEGVLRSAELTNNSFFRSLEMVQKNLEAVILRAENAEQRLHNLLTQTDLGKTDSYASAALLLSEGKAPDQVARMLGLPLQQVQMVQKLRRAVKHDDKPLPSKPQGARRGEKKLDHHALLAAGKKRSAFPVPLARMANGAAHGEKDAALQR